MSLLSSQGNDFGIAGAYKITIKQSRSPNKRNDVSTLDIEDGGHRAYEDGLEDNGPSGTNDGIIVTATVNTYGEPPAKGSIISLKGKDCKVMESETINDAGKPVEGVATLTSDY